MPQKTPAFRLNSSIREKAQVSILHLIVNFISVGFGKSVELLQTNSCTRISIGSYKVGQELTSGICKVLRCWWPQT